MSTPAVITQAGSFRGRIRPPSDKSLTHRALLLGALARPGEAEPVTDVDGPGAVGLIPVPSRASTLILDPLTGEDCLSTLACLRALGASGEAGAAQIVVEPGSWSSPQGSLDCGNSGTTMRLLAGLVASAPGVDAVLTGDQSLSRRPMGRVREPLLRMGADITGDRAPLQIRGRELAGIRYESPVASAQVKSCVLLAGLRASGTTWVKEPSLSRDHTERMLSALGVVVQRDEGWIGIEGGQTWPGFVFRVPADVSSAAFWLAAAAMSPGSHVELLQVGLNPTRTGILDVLSQTGAKAEVLEGREELGEPSGTLVLKAPDRLDPFVVEGSLVPRLIDEIPVLAVLATQCQGRSIIRDAAELRVKESDRIAVVARHLAEMGAKIEATDDGFIIEGPTSLTGTTVEAQGDHRIAMAFAIAGSLAKGETRLVGAESISTSYPDFMEHLHALTR